MYAKEPKRETLGYYTQAYKLGYRSKDKSGNFKTEKENGIESD